MRGYRKVSPSLCYDKSQRITDIMSVIYYICITIHPLSKNGMKLEKIDV